MKKKLNFESLKNPMFKTMGKEKMVRVRGGYTITLTACSNTGGSGYNVQQDVTCSDTCCSD